ncbi:MAG: type VI secretion system baseplate subunit TssF [Deltaproteobacteria bacterium]|nr:type VI secretion system baseplate subunit TssF [Deltaproteobacteria bacterium]
MDAEIQREFFTELQALDAMLVERQRGPAFVQREDPDVRRLMESLALFSARTRHAASDVLRESVQRLVHGHLDEFLAPQPTRGMVRAVPSPRLIDPVTLPAGTRLRVETLDDDVGMFTTTRDLVIRPLQLDWAERQLRGRRGYRILLRVRTQGAPQDVSEPLSLHLSHLEDYPASQLLLSRLRQHLQSISVFYDEVPTPDQVGPPCRHRLGGAADGPSDGEAVLTAERTIAGIREFFHHPARELFLHIWLSRPVRPWRQAWLCLDLDDGWPEDQIINETMFRLFVVPVENLFTESAEPIKADGTQSSFPITSWQPELRAQYHSVVEVTQQLPSGADVILPAFLASGRESYDVELSGEADSPQLQLRLPDAFTRPRVVSVLTRWYQPWFDGVAVGKLRATLQTRRVEGVGLQVQSDLRPHELSPLLHDASEMLQVMSRRAKRILSHRDIVKLMSILGAHERGHHGDVAGDILRIETREEPADPRRGGGVAYVYRVILADVDEDRRGLQRDYVQRVGELLAAWSSNPVRIELHRRTARERALGQGAET